MNGLGIVLWPVACSALFVCFLQDSLQSVVHCFALFVCFVRTQSFVLFCTPQVMLHNGQSAEREQSRVGKGETLKCELLEKTSEIFHVKSRF